jgi:hypothetical protein
MPGLLAELPARPAAPGRQQRADVGKRRETRPGLREHPAEQHTQLTVQLPQPRPVFYDGRDGRLLILLSHSA